MIRFALGLTILLLGTGCFRAQRYQEYTLRHDDGREKPKVLLGPIYPDDYHREFSLFVDEKVRDFFLVDGHFYSLDEEETKLLFDDISVENGFGGDLWFSKRFLGFDFVVLWEFVSEPEENLELVYNELSPPALHKEGCGKEVRDFAVRLRVIDIRKRDPKLILQEVFTSQPWMTRQKASDTPTVSEKVVCDRFSRTVASRIEEVILSSL